MSDQNEAQYEDDELVSFDDFDDEIDLDPTIEEPTETVEHQESEEERRRRARREIERRNELKALKSELDEWDELLNEVDL
jgi:hypothetical protein